ncbi:MAG: hypothetical protein NUV65_06020 [Candidatus Roizmanbacteria bacterium]|nr:hypothetical protein [Candidatus Roizmanbacteria bacterium]
MPSNKIEGFFLSTTDEINLQSLKDAYAKLCSRDFDEITLPGGKHVKYRDREALRKEIQKLENKLGTSRKTPRILEDYSEDYI